MEADRDSLLIGLSDAQREAVTADDPLLCIVAGAGSGKTRVLTRRVAWRAATESLDPAHTLVLTFTRKAASELGDRLDQLGLRGDVAAGTFHSLAYAQLRARWNDRDISAPKLIDRRTKLFGEAMGGVSIDAARAGLAEHDWTRARMIEPEGYEAAAAAARRRPVGNPSELVEAFRAFAALKRKRRLVDFDDLLALALRDLRADADYAAAMAWRFRHLFVDEFQDVNPLQFALLEAWRADRPDLCVVGDPDQAIYGWNGADASHLVDFDTRLGGRTIELTDNFRSSPEVVRIAHLVLAADRSTPTVHQPTAGPPVIVGHDDDRLEAAGIARAARDAHPPGTPWSTQAVLVRTNAQTVLIQEALAAAGIPYRVRGGRSFVEHPAVVLALQLLRGHPGRLGDALGDLRDIDLTELKVNDAVEHLDVVVRLAYDHLRLDRDCTARAFAELLGTTVAGEVIGPSGDAIDIATFHAAKGLEWSVVHLAGLEEGYVPIWQATSPEAVAEERRLLHVAMTRARTHLSLHWARRRTFGDHTSDRARSGFLRVLDEHRLMTDLPTAPDPGVRESLRTRRQELDSTPPFVMARDALHASLLAWRDSAARATGVDPAAVVSDQVLAVIADTRPVTETDLAAIDGFSAIRRARYGERLLEVVTAAGLE